MGCSGTKENEIKKKENNNIIDLNISIPNISKQNSNNQKTNNINNNNKEFNQLEKKKTKNNNKINNEENESSTSENIIQEPIENFNEYRFKNIPGFNYIPIKSPTEIIFPTKEKHQCEDKKPPIFLNKKNK